jgi:hypothetical protein
MHKVKEAGNLKFMTFSKFRQIVSSEQFFYVIMSGFMRRFPVGDFKILARNILRYGQKSQKKLQFVDTPWHTESRSYGTHFWFVMRVHTGHHHDPIVVMRVHTGHHHDPIGYGLGLMVTKRAHQVDGAQQIIII